MLAAAGGPGLSPLFGHFVSLRAFCRLQIHLAFRTGSKRSGWAGLGWPVCPPPARPFPRSRSLNCAAGCRPPVLRLLSLFVPLVSFRAFCLFFGPFVSFSGLLSLYRAFCLFSRLLSLCGPFVSGHRLVAGRRPGGRFARGTARARPSVPPGGDGGRRHSRARRFAPEPCNATRYDKTRYDIV